MQTTSGYAIANTPRPRCPHCGSAEGHLATCVVAPQSQAAHDAEMARLNAPLRTVRPSLAGRCRHYVRGQGCPLHGEVCR